MVGDMAHIKVNFVAPSISTPFPIREFDRCMEFVLENEAQGVVLDLRGNPGGVQALACSLSGYFLDEEFLFSDTAYVGDGGDLLIDGEERLRSEDQNPHWSGPLVVLVDHRTAGAAEGLARVLQEHHGAKVVGNSRSQGAFGVTGGGITLPGGYTVYYPIGAYVDEAGTLLVAGDGAERGGVVPDVRIPWTVETFYLQLVEGEDLVLERAVEVLAAWEADA